MKRMAYAAGFLAVVLVTPATLAQEAVAPASSQKTLAATMNVYVFPTAGQPTEQQSTDEAACYGWAVQNTGGDPFALQKQAQQSQQQADQARPGEYHRVAVAANALFHPGGHVAGDYRGHDDSHHECRLPPYCRINL